MRNISILHVVNTFNWSWGLVMDDHLKRLHGYDVYKIVRDNKNGIAADLIENHDLTLLQNMDLVTLMNVKPEKAVTRMGGMRTFGTDTTRYDDELSKVAAVICTNKELFEIAKRVNKNVVLIPNGVDLQIFKPRSNGLLPFDENGASGLFSVGFAGNISGKMAMDYKGWKYIEQAYLTLFTEVRTINALFRHDQIVHNCMPEEFYYRCDCVVLPSLGEGCSNTIAEALACGVPVLITKVGYHGEHLTDGKDCLFVERNQQDIADKIMMLKNDVDLRFRLSINGRVFAEKNHNIDKITKQYDDLFKTILKNKGFKE